MEEWRVYTFYHLQAFITYKTLPGPFPLEKKRKGKEKQQKKKGLNGLKRTMSIGQWLSTWASVLGSVSLSRVREILACHLQCEFWYST